MLIATHLAGATAGHAADENGSFAVDGVGSQTCRAYIDAIDSKDQRLLAAYASWMQGFVTGYNVLAEETFDITPWQSPELLILKMQSFCNANPETPFVRGVGGLIASLQANRISELSEKVDIRQDGQTLSLYREVLDAVRNTLGELGYDVPETSDSYDARFVAAVEAFQKDKNMPITGLPDQATLNALFP